MGEYKGIKDVEKRKAYNREYIRVYRKSHPYKGDHKLIYRNLRNKVLEKLGGAVCCECGCHNRDILEINHINGGGRREIVTRNNQMSFYRDVLKNRYDKDRLNVLCKVCNSLHYVRDILKISGHNVTWTKPL